MCLGLFTLQSPAWDEGSPRVKTTLGSITAEQIMECTKRRYVDSRKNDVSIKAYDGQNQSRLQRVQVMKSCTTSSIPWRPNGSFFLGELSKPFIFFLLAVGWSVEVN